MTHDYRGRIGASRPSKPADTTRGLASSSISGCGSALGAVDNAAAHQDAVLPGRLFAVYFGWRTLVLGGGSITLHRHTRGTLDRNAAIIGFARLGQSQAPGLRRATVREGDKRRWRNA